MNKGQIKELINRRRRQLTVHSFLYYQLDTNIISDHTFDIWAKELSDLQHKYPDIAKECIYADEFKDFDGSSGFDLPFHYPEIQSVGYRLLNTHKKKTSGN
jgi:NAD-dependent DNA ligase